MKASLLVVASTWFVAGCSNTVSTSGGGGTTTASSGATASTTSTSTATSGSTTTTTVSGTTTGAAGSTSASATSSTGSGGTCVGSIDISIDMTASVHWASECAGDWGASMSTTPVAYYENGGPAPGIHDLEIVGCQSMTSGSTGLRLSIPNADSVGSYPNATPQYTDAMGGIWGAMGDQVAVQITSINVGPAAIDGGFNGSVSKGGNAAHFLKGTFHVCKVNDENLP